MRTPVPAPVLAFANERGLTRVRRAGSGVEFEVFAAVAPDGSQVVLRTPAAGRFQSNANDRHVDTRSLLGWEYAVARHLDVRAPNLRCSGGTVRAMLDWSNALIGDPALELGRLAEYALLPDNGFCYEAILAGYQAPVAADSAAFWIYRLDAAVMLALLFSSELPGTGLGPGAVGRLREVHQQLTEKLADMT
jgi:hypothetical protein